MEEFEFQYYAPNQYHHNPGSQQGQQFVQYQKDSRCSKTSNMVYSMERMSPYYQDDSRSTNLSNLTLDQIFKSNQSDDQPNIVVVNSNESLMLFQQQQQQQQTQQQQQQQQANSGQQASTSASPSNTSMSSSSSPQSSSSPSSTNEANSTYGIFTFNNCLPLTPVSDTNGSSNLLSDFKVENMQLMECGMNQQQPQGQMQQQHHQGPTLVSLVPASASSMNPLLNPMMGLASPSKPSTVSELSNSSMVSSSSSSTLDSSQFRTGTSRTRARNANAKPISEQQKDGKYFERRKRNNVAAKKSRDARKQREDEIAIRASFLEKENSILKAQLQTLKDEAQQLRILLTQKKASQSMAAAGLQMTTSSCASCTNCMGKQVGQAAYVALNSAFDADSTSINMVDQKMSVSAGQQNASNPNSMYMAQTSHNQQLNRLL